MEIVYSIFIGIIFDMIVGMIDGIGLQCRRDNYDLATIVGPSVPRVQSL
jgi:hypothetical protein